MNALEEPDGMWRDVTERHLAVERRDRFLSHVSHELRAPLAVVHQFASLLADGVGGPLTSEQSELLTVMARNLDQLKAMIDDLLEGLPPVFADADRLRDVLVNRLDNAIKFTPTGGLIAVTATAHGTHVVVQVADTGRGIPPEDLERVFEQFFQVEHRGGRRVATVSAPGLGPRASGLGPRASGLGTTMTFTVRICTGSRQHAEDQH